MKNPIIYLLVITFLLHSCYTYKAVDLKKNQLIIGDQYKITQEDKTETAKLVAVNDSLLTVSVDKTEKDIAISNIKDIKRKNSAILNTLNIVAASAIVISIVALDIYLDLYE
jgi:hypothetical protein